MRPAITFFILLLAYVLVGCAKPHKSFESVEAFRQALAASGWHDVSFHPVDTATWAESGVHEAGLIIYGAFKFEVYRALDASTVVPVADFFAEAGLAVYVHGAIVAVVPDERGGTSVIKKLTELHFAPFYHRTD